MISEILSQFEIDCKKLLIYIIKINVNTIMHYPLFVDRSHTKFC